MNNWFYEGLNRKIIQEMHPKLSSGRIEEIRTNRIINQFREMIDLLRFHDVHPRIIHSFRERIEKFKGDKGINGEEIAKFMHDYLEAVDNRLEERIKYANDLQQEQMSKYAQVFGYIHVNDSEDDLVAWRKSWQEDQNESGKK